VKFVGIANHSGCALLVLGPLGGLLGGLAGSIDGFLQAPDYSRAVSHIANLPAAERRSQLLQAVRLSLLHAGATNANKFASPQHSAAVRGATTSS
jgi:hypothetical protein